MVRTNIIEVTYTKVNGTWEFVIEKGIIKAHGVGFETKRLAKRSANEILKDLRDRNVIHVNRIPKRRII